MPAAYEIMLSVEINSFSAEKNFPEEYVIFKNKAFRELCAAVYYEFPIV